MSTKLYVGNLSFNTTENDLSDLFAKSGAVAEVEIIHDKMTGRSRGFGFVTMEDANGAQAAIAQFNGFNLDGRDLTVNEARPREAREPRDFGGGNRGDRGGNRRFDRRR